MSILDVAQRISDVYRSKYKRNIIEIKIKPDKSDSMLSRPVRYSIEKLMKTGFAIKGDMNFEIDKTIALCEEFIK